MKSRLLIYISLALCIITISCKNSKEQSVDDSGFANIDAADLIKGDSMVYGLTCEGTTDSMILVYPFDGGDPVTYYTIDAFKENRIIGKPQVGDWVGLMLDKEDSTIATTVINLDLIKGTWTYPVMPTFKDFKHLSKRQQKRMEQQLLENMPDSMKKTYMVPREYGFTLKRSHVAQSVGRIMTSSSLESESLVEYPPVKNYRQWFMWNGRLILVSTDKSSYKQGEEKSIKFSFDTLSISYLDADSLILSLHGTRYGFHRKNSTIDANAEAMKKAQEADKKAVENLK